jgi:hypothetical protein
VGEANVGFIVDGEGLIGLELKIGRGHWLGAKVNTAEGEIIKITVAVAAAVVAVWRKMVAELAHINVAIAFARIAGIAAMASTVAATIASIVAAAIVTTAIVTATIVAASIVASSIVATAIVTASIVAASIVAAAIVTTAIVTAAIVTASIVASSIIAASIVAASVVAAAIVTSSIVAAFVVITASIATSLCCLGKDLRFSDDVFKLFKSVLLGESVLVQMFISKSLLHGVHSLRRRTC